jgi:anti-sigma-K factor RskA
MSFEDDRGRLGDAHARYEDDLAAYLLGALPGDEEEEFRAHLEGCERCRERERWLRTSVDMLPSSVEQLEPPPELRERLMETVHREAAEATAAADAAPAAGRRSSDAGRRGRRRWFSLPLRPMPALAAVLIVAAGLTAFLVSNGGDDSGKDTVIRAAATPAEPGAKGSLVRRGDQGMLRIDRLPLHRGKVYQVWVVEDGQAPRSAALFDVNRAGRGVAAIPHGLDQADKVLVTPEPPGGSPQPTADPVLSVDV